MSDMIEPALNEAKILLVDNDPIFFYLIKEILETEGYTIENASDGEKAISMAHHDNVDLILLDIMMPSMNGFEVCRLLQDDPVTASIPIIFLSAKDDEESYIKGFELGAIDYLVKPINQLDLILKIRNYLKLSRNEIKLKESELRYKSIVEDQTEFILRISPSGIISYANLAFRSFIKKDLEEIIGQNVMEIIKPEKQGNILQQFKKLTPEKSVQSKIRKIILPDGRVTWQQWYDRGIYNATQQLADFQIVGRDITIQKQYEEAINILTDKTSAVTGISFFNVLVKNLVKLLNVDFAVFGECIHDHPIKIQTLAANNKDEIIQNLIFSFSPEDSKRLIEKGFILINNESSSSKQLGVKLSKNTYKYYTGISILNKDKKMVGVLAIFSNNPNSLNQATIDIMKMFSMRAAAEYERNSSEQKLRESEKRYRMLADYNYDWEYWIGSDGKFLYVSPSCERITGYPSEEFYSNPDLIHKITHPDFAEMISNHYNTIHQKRLEFEVLEYKIIDRYGEEKWINHVCSPVFDKNNVFQGIRGNNRDITQRKEMENTILESEKKFRNIFQSSIDSMIISDFNHQLLESNKAFLNIIGLNEEDVEQLKITNFIHPNDKASFKEWFQNVTKTAIINRPSEFRLLNLKREIFYMEINSQIINYRNHEAVLSILRDVTERKEVHSKILNTIIETEEKERRRFAQDLHDGMGPLLSTIKLYTNSILTAKDEQKKAIAVSKSLETIDEAIGHTKEIAFNISPSILRDFGLSVAIKSYVNRFNDTKEININFQSEINERFKSNIEASLFRIIIELLNNTVKHAHANNSFIVLKKVKNHLLLQYSDDGIGIELNKTKEKYKGQGLFNIINRIKSIGGEIDIETDINQGFSVNISIQIE